MTDPRIEAAARALAKQHGHDPDGCAQGWGGIDSSGNAQFYCSLRYWEQYIGQAQAALAAAAPGHTDMMVSPESMDKWLEKNPLPEELGTTPAEPSEASMKAARLLLGYLVADRFIKDVAAALDAAYQRGRADGIAARAERQRDEALALIDYMERMWPAEVDEARAHQASMKAQCAVCNGTGYMLVDGDPPWEECAKQVPCSCTAATIERLTRELETLNAIFDKQWERDMEAVAEWRGKDVNRQLTLPDRGSLMLHVLDRAETAERQRDEAVSALRYYIEKADRARVPFVPDEHRAIIGE